MPDTIKPYEMITDFVTGDKIPNIGAEENRQRVERFLVEKKGYRKSEIEVGVPIHLEVSGEPYRSTVDLVIRLQGKRLMVIKCVAGSMGSRHRETLAAARLLDAYQIPFAVVSDGKSAHLLDTATGDIIAEEIDALPSRDEALEKLDGLRFEPFPESKADREKIIFRSYDEMNVNVARTLQSGPEEAS
ncbi:MAG: type I restriction enzyme HsdR N-terminal domain-containing protein [Deltaproteobacteria bacterium]|nr:type I restriction enzyme HsdR N-terminal domain-containing protein [Deltaproteobacteria bacterium]